MAGPPFVADRGVIFRPGIGVFNDQGDRGPRRYGKSDPVIGKCAGQDAHRVSFLSRGDVAAGPRAALVQPGLDQAFIQPQAGRAAIDNHAQGGAMTFAPCGDAE